MGLGEDWSEYYTLESFNASIILRGVCVRNSWLHDSRAREEHCFQTITTSFSPQKIERRAA